jgi:hypothetical protein
MQAEMVCESCGHVGHLEKHTPGSTAVGVGLLLIGVLGLVVFLPIGVVLLLGWAGYNVWRMVGKKDVCPSCKKQNTMLSTDSPRGRKLVAEFSGSTAGIMAP